jgi:hypothetical protein
MDFRQLSAQIGTQAASGELKASGGGGPLGSPLHDSGFSTILQALSHKTDGRMETKSRAPQAETNDRPFSTTPAAHRALSRKADGNRWAKPRDPQSEADDKPSSTTPAVHRALSRKTDGNRDAEPRAPQAKADDTPSTTASAVHRTVSRKADGRDAEPPDPQAKTDDGSSTTTSDVPTTVPPATSSGTDTESRAAQSKLGDTPSTTTPGADPLLLSLLGVTMVTPAPTVASTQQAAGTDASTTHVDGLSGISGTPTVQLIAQPAEGIASPVHSETGLSALAGHPTTSATGEAVAAVSSPMPEQHPLAVGTDTGIPGVEKSDISQPLTARQGLEAQSRDPYQGLLIMKPQDTGVPQPLVSSGQAAVNGQDPAQPVATVPTQPTHQNAEENLAPPDRSSAQQILGKGEPSLHQKNLPTESSEPQAAATLSGRSQAGGQGFSTESDGQRKGEGLKWFSHADLQSAEVSSRTPQQSTVEPLDAGRQSLPYQQGQGGTPPSIQSVPTPTVPSSSQANRLSPDPETVPAPLTHSVQFDLAPADFGQLRVRVVLSDHTIHTHMSTDRAELGQMLTGQQEQLSTQLTAAGLDLGRFQVQVDQERTNHSGQEWSSQPHSGTSQQQRDSRSQDRPQDAPVPSETRTGILNFFA